MSSGSHRTPSGSRPWKRRPGPLDSSLRQALAEHQRAPALYTQLMALPPRSRHRAVAREPRFATLALVAHLLAQSRYPSHPEATEEHARLALELADRLPPRRYPRALVWDFRGLACIALAEARLVRGDLAGAAAALAVAACLSELGTGDPLLQARRLEGLAALRRQQDRPFEARALERRVRQLRFQIGAEPTDPEPSHGSSFLRCGLRERSRGPHRKFFLAPPPLPEPQGLPEGGNR